MKAPRNITLLLQAVRDGDPNAKNRLLALVYRQLRAIAHRKISEERKGHTWQATELLNEWCVTVLDGDLLHNVTDRGHLFNTAALVMERLLVNRARRRKREKQGGNLTRVKLDDVIDPCEKRGLDLECLEVDLQALARRYPQQHGAFTLRFFCNLSTTDIAELTETPLRTVQARISFAEGFLREARKLRDS